MHVMKLAKRASVLEQQLDGEVVLLDLASGRYFGLDAAGARAWLLLGETDDTARIQAQLLSEFEVEEAVLFHDLDTFWQSLLDAGLVEVVPGS